MSKLKRKLGLAAAFLMAFAVFTFQMAAFAWMAVMCVKAIPQFGPVWLAFGWIFADYMVGEIDQVAAKFREVW